MPISFAWHDRAPPAPAAAFFFFSPRPPFRRLLACRFAGICRLLFAEERFVTPPSRLSTLLSCFWRFTIFFFSPPALPADIFTDNIRHWDTTSPIILQLRRSATRYFDIQLFARCHFLLIDVFRIFSPPAFAFFMLLQGQAVFVTAFRLAIFHTSCFHAR